MALPNVVTPHRPPQARGSTGSPSPHSPVILPIPAGAGLNRLCLLSWRHSHSDPRRRGAQPATPWGSPNGASRSPQARGSTGNGTAGSELLAPIPAGAGLNRPHASRRSSRATDPRRRGAQPSSQPVSNSGRHRSPQARGSTGDGGVLVLGGAPIPAGAGLNRRR